MTGTQDTWPAGATWVFQGTVAEDGTGGTHVCTLTVTPGAGNEMEVLYGGIVTGNTATSQVYTAYIDDGTNLLVRFLSQADTTASTEHYFPSQASQTTTNTISLATAISTGIIVSGAMRLILKVTTAAISVTQTFAVACRIKGAMPTATLADSVGTPVLTTNTNKVF